jgi:hypothetical protein
MGPRRVLDTKTYWLADRQSQYEFDYDFDNELVVGLSPVCKNVSTEAKDIVGIIHQVTTGEVPADWES